MESSSAPLSDTLVSFLLRRGEGKQDIEKYTYETRYYHDLDNWGDDAWDLAEGLQQEGVDMSTFLFEDYFPPEFPNLTFREKLFCCCTFGLFYIFHKDKKDYKPVTMRMIEKILIAKSWAVVLDE